MCGSNQGHFWRSFDKVVIVNDEFDGDLLQGVGVVKVSREEIHRSVRHGDRFAKTGESRK